MSVLLISYTLRNTQKDYSQLFEAIKNKSNGWWHYPDNIWIVNTGDSADTFAKKLYPFLEKPDYLFVVKITSEHQGWLPKEAWDWLNKVKY